MWVDSHCHLDMIKTDALPGKLSGVIDSAKQAQVEHLLCVCVDLQKFESIEKTAALSSAISLSAGIHPLYEEPRALAQWRAHLEQLASHDRVVAIGETGLDYHYDTIPRAVQQERFAQHIAVSCDTDKPLIIHTREAREDTIALMQSEGQSKARGVMHCFTETWEMAKAALDLGFYISVSGIVTFKSASALREVVKKVPLDRLLVETDSPYLAPVPHRGKGNEPQYVPLVGQFVAELKNISIEACAEATTDNFYTLFSHVKAQPLQTVTALNASLLLEN